MVETSQTKPIALTQGPGTTPPRKLWMRAVRALALWTGLGLLFSFQGHLLWPVMPPLRVMQMTMPRWYAWGVLAEIIFAVDHRAVSRLTLKKRILFHIPLGIVCTFVVMTLDYAVQNLVQFEWRMDSMARFFLQNFFAQATIYAVIAGASLATSYAAEARKREQEATELAVHSAQLETHLTEARLRVLQAQLNPHFLFNAFNTISALTETDPKVARRMMARLGALLRSSLDHAGRQEVTLAEELRFLDDYLAIERIRFEDRLTVEVSVSAGVQDALVPSFVLQPLVENAIRHGTGATLRSGNVRLSARSSESLLVLAVEDDGVGLPEGWRLEDHAGVGLSNIARRLAELYGSKGTFSVENLAPSGVRVEMKLPLRRTTETAARTYFQAADVS
jgi:two-component system LytT family sensor kinase